MTEATFHSLTERLKQAGHKRASRPANGAQKTTERDHDPTQAGVVIAEEGSDAFREAIKKRQASPTCT